MPKAARKRVASSPAGTALTPRSGLPAQRVRMMGEFDLNVTETETNVNRSVTHIYAVIPEPSASEEPGIHNPAPGLSIPDLPLSRQSGGRARRVG